MTLRGDSDVFIKHATMASDERAAPTVKDEIVGEVLSLVFLEGSVSPPMNSHYYQLRSELLRHQSNSSTGNEAINHYTNIALQKRKHTTKLASLSTEKKSCCSL